ncbi:FAD-dependent oxidoreductase [Roseofilum sp. BLCC_M91]|uniref:FAD-dependent oxidoreductase n=1 Tax=Roseofilum halophilum BLCC-M91 TaxID=3022259 RepID=A0ABT7BP54_9CYAN|nr:FAD-dependent oxidoreductase [Roseofilum halophilum]MDJ1180957.1 FAD-dependent oxidoreductase [Roseofilum halophilum BLCC-M91]
MKKYLGLLSTLLITGLSSSAALATPEPDRTVSCDLLVVGGGLAGTATAYEALLGGKTVCLTELTDWVGGQISSQGTSALDERTTQRAQLFYSRGYLELRDRIFQTYGKLNPGECWVSVSCFLPKDGHLILMEMLETAAKRGKGTLHWYPNTVVKDLDYNGDRTLIEGAIAIQHQAAPNAPPLNTRFLSQTLEDAYTYDDSEDLTKTIIEFTSPQETPWYVIDATETGELIGLTNVPHRLGIDGRSPLEPSSASETGDPYCTQGFTYTFAMEAMDSPQPQEMPEFYPQYAPYYSYELERLASFDLVFTYRRIWSPQTGESTRFGGIGFTEPTPGDIAMQNWTWGNDYRPGTSVDNFIYTRDQLQATGQLQPGGWMGGLRVDALRKAEEHALGFYYWLVAGTTDSQLGDGFKEPHPNYRFLSGLDSPMGTAHGLSKYPYMREGRRIIGRPSWAHPDGFTIWEIDISRQGYTDDYYQQALPPEEYRAFRAAIAGLEAIEVLQSDSLSNPPQRRTRSTIFPDAVGIGHYAIDFHPCMTESPPEKPGNTEREGERRGAGRAYPFQIPLRAMIPQQLDNFLIAGKSIAASHIAAAAYRVHSFEWSVGAAAGNTVVFALENEIMPYELVDNLPAPEPQLEVLQQRLINQGNPIAFPNTSILNEDWDNWQ